MTLPHDAVWREIAANEVRTGYIFGRALLAKPLPRIGKTLRPQSMPACQCGNVGPFFCDCIGDDE